MRTRIQKTGTRRRSRTPRGVRAIPLGAFRRRHEQEAEGAPGGAREGTNARVDALFHALQHPRHRTDPNRRGERRRRQADRRRVEDLAADPRDIAEIIVHMCNVPDHLNFYEALVVQNKIPFLGRG